MKIEVELPPELDWVKETLEEAMVQALDWSKDVLATKDGQRLVKTRAPEHSEAILGRIAATRDLVLALEGRYEGLLDERQRALDVATGERPEA